jgi:hypothetical protein
VVKVIWIEMELPHLFEGINTYLTFKKEVSTLEGSLKAGVVK